MNIYLSTQTPFLQSDPPAHSPPTPACPGTQQKDMLDLNPILKNTVRMSVIISGRALDFPPFKASRAAAESEQMITSLGLVSSIPLKAHRIAINSDVKTELPLEMRRPIFTPSCSTYIPNPALPLTGSLDPSVKNNQSTVSN